MILRGTKASTTLCVLALLAAHTVVSAAPTANQRIKIQTLNYTWIAEGTAEVTACVSVESKTEEETRFGQLELLVTNALGRSWRSRGVSLKTDNGFCFSGLNLEKEDLVKTLTFRVLESENNELIQEVETFLIVPRLTPVTNDVSQICWDDPEGLAFALAEEGLVTPTVGCRDCCVYVTSRNPGDTVALETGGSHGFRQVVKIHLPRNLDRTTPEPPIDLKIKELHKVMRDDDPSGRNQNMKVVLEPHTAMDADDFELTLNFLSGEQKTYFLQEILDEDATEIEFEGNFENSKNVIIKAEKDGSLVGFGSVVETITDLGSRVARVGDESAPSLRVDPGARDQVEVPGKRPCLKGSVPCYYFGQSEPPAPLCEDLPSIKFCDAIVSEVQNPPNVPTLELHNREELRVQPQPVGPKTEVVVSSTQDDSILSPDDLGCNDLGDDMCSQPVDIADDLESFDVTIVTLDDEGYVTESIAVLFEVHRVSTVALFPNMLKVAVDPQSEGTYEVTLLGPSSLEAATECQAGSPCRFWFAGEEAPTSVSVKKESNVIFQEISTETPPPTSEVKSITSMNAENRTRVEVLSDKIVSKVELVTFISDVATEADCEDLAAISAKTKYYFDASIRGPGGWNFIFEGYCDGGSLCEVGQASLTLIAMDARVSVVGAPLSSPDASLRVDVRSQDDVAIEGVGSCVKADSPCYFLTQSLTEDTLRYCVTITNSAGLKSQDIDQCDSSFTPFNPMAEEPMLKLIDGESIEVTPSGPAVNVVEMVVFNPKTDAVLNGSSPECSPKPDGSCSQEVDIPQDLKDLEVLVVALDKEGEVEESVLLPFYDMKVTTRQLTSDMLEVAWTANQPEDYSVSLLSSSPPLTDSSPSSLLSSSSSPSSSSSSLSSSPSSSSSLSSSLSSSSSSSLSSSSSSSSPTSSSSSLSPSSSSSLSPSLPSSPHAVPTPSSATEIKTTCNEGGCLAHFAGLVSGETYTVQVHKEGTDNLLTGATAHMDTPDEDLPPICPVESLTTDPGSATDITVNISSFAATVTSAYVGVRLQAEAREVSLEAVPLPGGADGIFEVTHEGQDLPAGQVMLVFKASDGTSNFCVSKTVVMLEVLDAQLSWVGEKYSANSSSLRVDTGTFKEITVQQGKVCKKEESPCYFLRDELPTTVPRCVTLTTDEGETISQCEDFVRPFKELPGEFSVSLDGNDKIVVAGAYPGNTTMEITIYDPLAPADIMSHGETSCEEVVAAGRSSDQRCSQVFNAPKDQRSLRVLVVAVGEGGAVEGSLLKEFTYTKQGVAVWIIVVSVLASVIVVALVGFGISTIVKKKKKAKQHKVNSTDSQVSYRSRDLHPWELEQRWQNKHDPEPAAMFDPLKHRPLVLPRISFERQTSGESVTETYRYVGRYQNSAL